MKTFLKTFAVVALLVASVSACRTAPVYNAENVSFDKPFSSQAAAGNAIKQAAKGLGWKTSQKGDGKILARINVRGKHDASVLVKYDNKKFSIVRQATRNLKYDAEKGTIHSNYNGWVQNLENAIVLESNYRG